jgi:putative DNA primase/helicase
MPKKWCAIMSNIAHFIASAKQSYSIELPNSLIANGELNRVILASCNDKSLNKNAMYRLNHDGSGEITVTNKSTGKNKDLPIKPAKPEPATPAKPAIIETQAHIEDIAPTVPTGIEQQQLSEEKRLLNPVFSSSLTALDSIADDTAMTTNNDANNDHSNLNDCPDFPPFDDSITTPDDYDHDTIGNDGGDTSATTEKPVSINLSNPKESEDFARVIIEKLTDCTNELEAINAVVEAITSNNANGFNKTIAGYLAGQITDKVQGLKGKKTAINAGIIKAVKDSQAKKRTALSKSIGKGRALSKPLPADEFPHIVPHDDGTTSILSTVDNLKHLLSSYGITAVYDEVAKSQELILSTKKSTLNHDLHNESSIQQVCSQAALNGINENIINRLAVLMTENTINPVKDFIFSKKWDGVSRINQLCSSLIVSSGDRELTNKIMKVWLIQCIAALDRAVIGCAKNHNAVAKYELVLTFQGIQGATKTTWLSSLLPREYKGEKFSSRYILTGSTLQLDNKDSIKQNVSCWINELGELDATFRKSDIAALKAFLSKLRDILRLPYAKAECSFARSTSFCASVNDEQFLNDSSGSRRFGVVKLIALETNKTDMQQLWAEVWQLYASGEQWWLDKETENAMQLRNEQHQNISPIEDAILTKFDWDSPSHLWTKRLTMTEIYQLCFDKKPNRADLNAIKPFITKKGVKVSTTNAGTVGCMPIVKDNGY